MLLRRITVTPTVLGTALVPHVYTADTVLFTTMEVLASPRVSWPCHLRAMTLHDKADQGVLLDFWFLRGNVSLGAIDSAFDLGDDDADYMTGHVQVTGLQYYDVGGVKVALKAGLNIPLQPVDGDVKLYLACTCSKVPPTTVAGCYVIDLWVEEQ
jgi:hypothetical protein